MKKTILLVALTGLVFTGCGRGKNKAMLEAQSSIEVTGTPVQSKEPLLDTTTYEVFATQHNSTVQNFHILIKTKFDRESLQDFANKFKIDRCTGQCNIMIYDDRSVVGLATKYPLPDSEYLQVADHFVGLMDFSDDSVWWYPYQDFHYKELGGTNWKKEPIQ